MVEKRLYAVVLTSPSLLRDIISDAKKGEIVIRGVVVFAEMSPQKAGGYTQRGALVYRVERLALTLTLMLLG